MPNVNDTTFEKAVAKAEHYLAIGQTEIYLYRDADIPAQLWKLVSIVDAGGSYRLNGPASARFAAPHESGLTFKWSVDFEQQSANGTGTHQFDRERLRDVIRKLSPDGARKFAALLSGEVLTALLDRTREIEKALNVQQDSLDCVRGLIAFAEEHA